MILFVLIDDDQYFFYSKAPRFSQSDHSLACTVPRRAIVKQKEDIIKIVGNTKPQPPKEIKQERTEYDYRIKQFIKSLAELS